MGLIHNENASTEGGALAPRVIRINNLGTEGGARDVGLIHLYWPGGTVPPPPANIPLDQVDVTWCSQPDPLSRLYPGIICARPEYTPA